MSAAVPLPPEHIPEGTAVWQSVDARRWRAAGPGGWTHPLWASLAVVVAVVWSVAAAPDVPCTAAAPCDTVWDELAVGALALLCPYWIWRRPPLALAVLAGYLGGAAVEAAAPGRTVLAAGGDPWSTWPVAQLAALFAAVSLTARLVAGRRRGRTAREAAGPARHRPPPAARDPRRGLVSLGIGVLLLAGTAYAVADAQRIVAEYERRAAGATRVTAEVKGATGDPDGVTALEAEDPAGRRHALHTVFPEYYPVGTEVEVVYDGSWTRLVSEPYELIDQEIVALLTGVPGLLFLADGLAALRRVRERGRSPQPVLGVLVRPGPGRALLVHAGDAPDGGEALFTLRPVRLRPARSAAGDRVPGPLPGRRRFPREALLFGTPRPGGEVFLAAPGEYGLFTVGPGSPVGREAAAAPPSDPRPRRNRNALRPPDEVAAGMVPVTAPRVWSADRASRGVALFLLLVPVAGTVELLTGNPSPYRLVLGAVVLPTLLTLVAAALNWRVSAGRTGVWVTGAWRVRHVPWEQLTGVRHVDDGLRIGVSGKEEIRLYPTGFLRLQQLLKQPSAARRAAEEVRALRHHPELRPAADPQAHGMPLGPVLTAGGVLLYLAVVLL
ncbi:hypothetical protein ACWDR0_13700 [Streptomyces sp. NPDC003691]